jgi:hypothetical protein
MLACPALDIPRERLNKVLQNTLTKWNLPFVNMQVDLKVKVKTYWQKSSSESFKQKITSERLSLLLEDFWNSNAHKPSVPRVTFVPEVKKALVEHNLLARAQSLSASILA